MKINLLFMLPYIFACTAALGQPSALEYLSDGDYSNSAVAVNGVLFFGEYNALVKYDAQEGLYELKNVEGKARNLRNVNGVLYFTVFNQVKDEATLWKSDGTPEGTLPVVRFTETFNHPSPVTNIGNTVYFGFQDKLYRTDGTEAGTAVIKDLNASGDQGFLRLEAVANFLYISFRKAEGSYELWRSDGTNAGTTFLRPFGFVEFLQATNASVYFVGDDGSTGRELWSATAAGNVSLVQDIHPGSAGSFSEGAVSAVSGESVVFATTSPAAVWATSASTTQLAHMSASEIVAAGEAFYFISGNELWRTNGTPVGTTLLKKFPDTDMGTSRVNNLTAHGSTVFFVVNGLQLWQSDGSEYGTIIIMDHRQGRISAGTMTLRSTGTVLYYFASFSEPDYSNEPHLYQYDPASLWVPSMQLVDAATDRDIRFPENNTVVFTDETISIRADASLATERVAFYINGTLYRRERARPFALAGDNNGNYNAWKAPPGSYQLRVVPYSSAGAAGRDATYNITVLSREDGCGSGNIVREYWTNITGNKVSLIPVYRRPIGTEALSIFEGPVNAGINYGARIKGFICAPTSGDYTFWIASNDHSELWLSSDADPRNKAKIAYVLGATAPREWNKFRSQKSALIHLEAGQRYYIEALHKQGVGTDNLAVGWQLPGGELERPIPGTRLTPFSGNVPPQVKITAPVEGQTFVAPASIDIVAEGGDYDGFITRYEIFADDKMVEDYNSRVTWSNVPEGTYVLTVKVTDNEDAQNVSEPVTIVVEGQCTASGSIGREYWTGVQGNLVSDIPLAEPPSGSESLSLFEGPENSGINYGARIRGFICPPASGDYVFWIASNDHSELWLSKDDDPANKIKIAYVSGATASRQWDKFVSQRSDTIPLLQGKKYFIEALHKQGVGTDNLAVGWQLPEGTLERPIPGNRLSPYAESGEALSRVVYPPTGSADVDPLVMKIKIQPVTNARRYTLEVSRNADFSGNTMTINSIEDHQIAFILKDLEHATTYYVRVKTDVSGFGQVSEFTTRSVLPQHRLWGLTTVGGNDDLGTIFSYSIDSAHFVKHHDKALYRDQYGEGEDDYIEYEERLIGTPVAGPEGTLYGQSDHPYTHDIFEMDKEGNVRWLQPLVFINEGNIMLGSDNTLYITTEDYLAGGTVSRYPIDEPSLARELRVFDPREYGSNPSPRLLESHDGFFYGTARTGGLNNGGVVYRIRGTGADYQVIHYFDSPVAGMNPHSGLTEANGFLYGTTAYGGAVDNMGTIFRMTPDGNEFVKVHDFDGTNGRNPMGELIVIDGVIYGMTTEGGSADLGIVYRMNLDGSGFTSLHDFSGLDGAIPSGALTHDRDGNLYGMTSEGGTNGLGVIFKIHSSGAGFAKLFDFSASSGGRPNGSLVIREDTFSPPPVMSMTESETIFSVSIHPNPSMDHFNIQVTSPREGKIQVVVTDQYGYVVTSYEIANDTPTAVGADLKRGLYIVKIMQGAAIAMKRVVKK